MRIKHCTLPGICGIIIIEIEVTQEVNKMITIKNIQNSTLVILADRTELREWFWGAGSNYRVVAPLSNGVVIVEEV